MHVAEPIPKYQTLRLPRTFSKRAELPDEISLSATFNEYVELVHTCDYRIQYSHGSIYSFIETDLKTNTTMGEAAPIHEQINNRLIRLLGVLLDEGNSEFISYGSNIKIFIAENQGSYNPDCAFVKGKPEFITYKPFKKKLTSLVNPYIVVEVLSDGTRGFDLSEKLSDYQSIDSLQQIIYVEPNEISVTTYVRSIDRNWQKVSFKNDADLLPIVDKGFIKINDIYKNLIRF